MWRLQLGKVNTPTKHLRNRNHLKRPKKCRTLQRSWLMARLQAMGVIFGPKNELRFGYHMSKIMAEILSRRDTTAMVTAAAYARRCIRPEHVFIPFNVRSS